MYKKLSKNHELVLKQLAKSKNTTVKKILDERESNKHAKYKHKQNLIVLSLKKKKRDRDLIDLKRLAAKQKLLRKQIQESS